MELPLEDRVLLAVAYWRTNLTLRQLAPLFGASKSAADRIVDDIGPRLALQHRRRYRRDTVPIVDGTLVPTQPHLSDYAVGEYYLAGSARMGDHAPRCRP